MLLPKSDFETSYGSDSVVLELSVADFCLGIAFVRNSVIFRCCVVVFVAALGGVQRLNFAYAE